MLAPVYACARARARGPVCIWCSRRTSIRSPSHPPVLSPVLSRASRERKAGERAGGRGAPARHAVVSARAALLSALASVCLCAPWGTAHQNACVSTPPSKRIHPHKMSRERMQSWSAPANVEARGWGAGVPPSAHAPGVADSALLLAARAAGRRQRAAGCARHAPKLFTRRRPAACGVGGGAAPIGRGRSGLAGRPHACHGARRR